MFRIFGPPGTGKTTKLLDMDRKSTRLNSSHGYISYAVVCLKKKIKKKKKKKEKTKKQKKKKQPKAGYTLETG